MTCMILVGQLQRAHMRSSFVQRRWVEVHGKKPIKLTELGELMLHLTIQSLPKKAVKNLPCPGNTTTKILVHIKATMGLVGSYICMYLGIYILKGKV